MNWWKGLLGLEQDRSDTATLDRKETWTLDGGRAATSDRDNFVTNRVTVAEYNDAALSSVQGALALSTAWACVRLIAGTISSLPLVVYKTTDGGRVPARDHPLYRILHDSPNADQTALNFWQFMSAAVELHGNAYAEVARAANGRVIALMPPVAADCMTVRRLDGGELEYETREGGRSRKIRQEDILHIRGFGGAALGGMSTLYYGARAFGMAQTLERAAGKVFSNGVRPSGVLSTDKALSPEQRQVAEKLLQEKFTGAMNAGRPMLLDNAVKWESLSINPEDAQMLQSRAFSVEEICRFFLVPPHMIGHTEKTTSWGTGLEQQTLGFVQYSLRERLKNIESTLEKQLLTEIERQQGMRIEFNLEGLLRADSAGRAKFYGDMSRIGAMTINEIRALENLPPVAGGDVPRMQSQNIPITETEALGSASMPKSQADVEAAYAFYRGEGPRPLWLEKHQC